jgi:glycosyltransferase involved in cell wall biosynthesis
MRVIVYAIARNERQFVERFLHAVREADAVVVLDTGSTDGTPQALRECGAQVYHGHIVPWRFDDARNASLALVPSDADLCLNLDLDEVMEDGWRAALESVWTPAYNMVRHPFVWSHHADGSPSSTVRRNRCHARTGFRWEYPIHECLVPTGGHICSIEVPGMACHHYPDATKSRASYLPALEQAWQQDNTCARMAYYLAREYTYHDRWDEAKQLFLRYLTLPQASWAAERAEAMRYLAKASVGDERIAWLHRAVAEDPSRRDAWVDLAYAYQCRQCWTGGVFAIQQALAITDRFGAFITYDDAWGAHPYDVASVCYSRLGMQDEARQAVREALRRDPFNARIRENATRWMGVPESELVPVPPADA